jgi:hypothetical protein
MWGVISDERKCVSFTIAAGPRQPNHSQVRVPRDSKPYFTVSDSRLLQPAGSGPPGTGWPSYAPGTGFPFRRFLRLAGLWRRYSNPRTTSPRYISPARTAKKASLPLLRVSSLPATAVVLSPVYTAVTWQWVYMSQYHIHPKMRRLGSKQHKQAYCKWQKRPQGLRCLEILANNGSVYTVSFCEFK